MVRRHVWRFSDGSEIEFDAETKEISGGRGRSYTAMLCIREAMPALIRLARSQEELDHLIIGALEALLK